MAKRTGIVAEFWLFVKTNKTYWLIPILVVLLVIFLFAFLGSTGAAPFIYTLF